MSSKEFVFNVIVTKLQLANEFFAGDETLVKFDWGDDQDLCFEIKPDRINVTEFDIRHNLEFKRNVSDFVENLESKLFKLTVFVRKKLDGVDTKDLTEEEEGKEVIHHDDSEEQGSDDKNETMEIIGEAECTWPSKLVASFKTNIFSSLPFVESYDLNDNGSKVGSLTISMLLYIKCEEDTQKIFKGPYVGKDGKLGIFQECADSIDPNDIFFVVGNPPCPQPMTTNILSTCGGKGCCPSKYEPSRLKFMQGSLISDCNAISECGAQSCCQAEGDKKLCDEVLEEIKSKCFKSGKRKQLDVCYKDPCERLFGSLTDSCDALTSTDNDVPCHAEFHTIDCERKRKKKERRKQKSSKSRCGEQVGTCQQSFQPCKPTDADQLIEETIKNDRFDRRRQEILYPHTCSTPQLLAPAKPEQRRICPICNEDVSWIPLYGTCPKCGFQPSFAPPLQETPYDENKTAAEILGHLKQDLQKYRREKKIGLLGSCNCTPDAECLNCQIRKLSELRGEEKADMFAKKNQPLAGKENKVRNIIKEILKKRALKKSKISSNDNIPSMKMILECCKKKSAKKFGMEFYEDEQSSESSLSHEYTEYSSILKAKVKSMLAECNISTNNSAKKSSQSSEAERDHRQMHQNIPKKQPARKAKYYNKDEYPGLVLGHRDCVRSHRKVPRYMGWLWSASIDEGRRGWRPGAVRRETHKIMEYFLKDREADGKTAQQQGHKSNLEGVCASSTPKFKMPTIRVIKKRGQFRVTVHPMRDPSKPVASGDTRSLPIEFTIDKDPVELVKREVKSRLKKMGFQSCTCGKPIYDCECRSDIERDKLEDALEDVCDDLCIEQDRSTICFSDTTKSESEMDMEFSPPAALLTLPLPKKPQKCFAETQCDPEDIRLNTNQHEVWKIDPKEAVTRAGKPCGGMSRSPQCRPPWPESKIRTSKETSEIPSKPISEDHETKLRNDSKQEKRNDKSKPAVGQQKLSKPNVSPSKEGPGVKSSEMKKSDKPRKTANEVRSTSKPASAEKSAGPSKGSARSEHPPDQPGMKKPKQEGGEQNMPAQPSEPKHTEAQKLETALAAKSEQTKSSSKSPEKPSSKPSAKPPLKSATKSITLAQNSKREPLKPIKPNTLRQLKSKKFAEGSNSASKKRLEEVNKGKPDRPRKGTAADVRAQKLHEFSKLNSVIREFSMSQLPLVREVSIKPRKDQPCQEASLMGVRFRALDCNQVESFPCSIPPGAPQPCNVSRLRPHCPNSLR